MMRCIKVGIVLLSSCLILCCSPKKEKSKEDQLWSCLIEQQKEEFDNASSIIKNIEEVLIEQEILSNHSGKAYKDFFERSKLTNEAPVLEIESFEKLNTQLGILIDYIKLCSNQTQVRVDTNNHEKTIDKYYTHFNDFIRQKDFTVSEISEGVLSSLKDDDFNHSFYKMNNLAIIFILIESNKSISVLLPKWKSIDKDFDIKKLTNTLNVYTNQYDKLFIDDIEVGIEDVEEVVQSFILTDIENGKKKLEIPSLGQQNIFSGIISIRNEGETSYSFYIGVYNEIIASISKVRDEYSNLFYGNDYELLNKEQKEIIRTIIPNRISEQQPDF